MNKIVTSNARIKPSLIDVKIPNKKTIKAIEDADTRKTHKSKNVDALFEDL